MRKSIITLVFFFLSAFGCLPAPDRHVVPQPKPEVRTLSLVSTDVLDERIRVISRILSERGLSEKDRKLASDVLSSYVLLREVVSSQPTRLDYQMVIHDLFRCLSLFDEKYFLR
ncbi:MAG: hypothetical protein SV775_13890, partial [Thermodesulfobacteriota bacterium]|nr:hypothetical protein [Thermodesulfobacteriota bacterium]